MGCFLIGSYQGFAEARKLADETMRLFLVTGILGGFTTFSAFGWETIKLLRESQHFSALAYMFLSLFAGLLATFVGYGLCVRLGAPP